MKESPLAKTILGKKNYEVGRLNSLDFHAYYNTTVIKAYGSEDFPGSPVVRTPCFQISGHESDP